MADAPETIIEPAVLRFSEAVFQVMEKRGDFGGYIWPSFRELVEEMPGLDPMVEQANLNARLERCGCNPTSEEGLRARSALAGAALHVWYKVPSDLEAAVFQAVREQAIVNGEDALTAEIEVSSVIDGARTAGQALSKMYEASKAEAAKRRRKREQAALAETKRRLGVD